ncbi:MAG: glycosyltransferase family 4 protein [Thermoproteota archaeon]
MKDKNVVVVRPFPAPWEMEEFEELGKYGVKVFYITTGTLSSGYEFILRKRKEKFIVNLPPNKMIVFLTKNMFFNKVTWFRLIWPDMSTSSDLEKNIRDVNPEVVDTIENYTLSSLLLTIWKRKFNYKNLVTSWENIEMPFHRFSLRYLVNFKADAFRAMTKSAKDRLIKENVKENQIYVIPPAINVIRFSPGPSKLREELNLKGKSVVLFVGRLVRQKGVIELTLAMRLVKKRIKNAFLLIVGGGPLEAELRRLIRSLSLERDSLLYGPVPYEHIQDIYRVGDVLVLPSIPTKSWKEQFGHVLAEAMSTEVPVVASNCGAIPEVVLDNKTGFLVKPGDVFELAQKIVTMLKDDELRVELGRNGRKHIIDNYSFDVVVPKLKHLYYSL